MNKAHRVGTATFWLALTVVILVSSPASAQPGRPQTPADLAVAEYRAQGGTWIIPGRGRLADTADVASYRNMLTMIRDRVQDLIRQGKTLEQVKGARPTMDFDGRFGATTGPWTTEMFVEAVFASLKEKK